MKKRILSVILMLAILLSFTACGSGDKEKLVGTWKCEMDLAEQINTEMGLDEESAEYLNFDSFTIVLYMQINEDDTYSLYADTDALEQTMEAAMASFAEGMTKYLEDMVLAETGIAMSADDILAASNTTMDEMLAEAFPEGMVEELAEGMKQEGKFKAKDGKFYTSAGLEYEVDPAVYETYTLEGTTLTLLEYVGEDAGDTMNVYPMVFNKVS